MSSSSASQQPALKYQALGDLRDLPRSALLSHYRRKVDDLADESSFPALKAFLPNNLEWVVSYLKYVFKRKHPFQSYPPSGERGLYPLQATDGKNIRISIAGDWGTGTRESSEVADAISRSNADYTIHLGDVYYVGDPVEVQENCLGKTEFGYQGVKWPKGKLGSFSMNGNHEMYANGKGYFDVFMPTLGIPSSHDGKQLASFFCLENDVWRILALDTGYNSTGLPILSQIPLIKRLPGVRPSCKLETEILDWLRTVVKPKERPRATILLTHHQYYSAFEDEYTRPAKQLMEFFAGQDLLWIWGHEHRWAVYGKHSSGSLTAYGRCVGHGGMPVELNAPKNGANAPLQYFDERVYQTSGITNVGFNGFLNLDIQGALATLDYRDVKNRTMLKETFTAGSAGSITQSFAHVDPEISRGAAAPPSAEAASPSL